MTDQTEFLILWHTHLSCVAQHPPYILPLESHHYQKNLSFCVPDWILYLNLKQDSIRKVCVIKLLKTLE